VHRVGRTARAGETGTAITLLSSKDYDVFNQILTQQGMKVKELPKENFKKLRFEMARREDDRMPYGRGSPSGRPPRREYSDRTRSGSQSGPRRESSYGSRDSSDGQEHQRAVRWGGR